MAQEQLCFTPTTDQRKRFDRILEGYRFVPIARVLRAIFEQALEAASKDPKRLERLVEELKGQNGLRR